mmetsp:Transcript_49443/g.98184  ORF Transcript_49443/g.98184 Transcript_49443/m.98184 type:complete len:140 (-) Transcript_49443:254-673(-)|eukprot:CAMPEP_0172656172 /NCGR_PEP_ID=MMETSP1074-20121228/1177_1 /TAXON_ID=2916 /ORGANISM="Ceratium fusus, Strain PA161109" /LENGTH=139 /DNA_ID=CAMNT_0013470961 /DNA_START=64 /DNA_END=483 /DNA_ORIENTATION=+
MKAVSIAAIVLTAVVMQATSLRTPTPPGNVAAPTVVAPKNGSGIMHFAQKQLMEVKLGPFKSASDACSYCFTSFTKEGVPPAGPVAPTCICMSYPEGGSHTMFCATPPSSAKFVSEKGGCRCNQKDMENMGSVTCTPIS